jgi:predicted HicB family RNase H-like nuclease
LGRCEEFAVESDELREMGNGILKVYVAAKQAGTSLNVWITQTLAHETEHLD